MARSAPHHWKPLLAALFVLALSAGAAHAQKQTNAKYPFALEPLEMHTRLVEAGLTNAEALPKADRKVLAAFWADRSAQPTVDIPQADDHAVTLHLIASGVTDPKQRAAYLKKFDALVNDARTATAGAKTDGEKAERLLKFLHRGAMCKGYCADETTLSRLFDTGKFNCVSSSCVYFLVGTRLGLKLQPVLIDGTASATGHAALDLITDGKRTEIEPTSPHGFDSAAKAKRPGVTVIAPSRKGAYDADGFALAASIASNRGAGAKGADAVNYMVVALVLAPDNVSVCQNASATVVNWGLALLRAEKYEESLKVHAFGRIALGTDKSLENNYRATWDRYLESVFAAGKVEDGLKLLARAAEAFPNEKAFADPSATVCRYAFRKIDPLLKKKMFDQALAAVKEFGPLAADLNAKVFDRWAQSLAAEGKWADAVAKYVEGLEADPKSTLLSNNVIATIDQWAQKSISKKDWAAAVEVYDTGLKHFPDHNHLQKNRRYCLAQQNK